MKSFLAAFLMFLSAVPSLYASQSSVIVESDGYACMGDDKSRKQTETAAFADAKRRASEHAVTYIQSETQLKDALLEKDLISAFTNSQVRVIQELEKEWYKDASLGDCYRVKLKAEVIPDEQGLKKAVSRKNSEQLDDPTAPLTVKVWSDKPKYAKGEKIRVFIKGNRPFYGRVVYKDATGGLVQLLPNPYRQNSYFNGGTIYEIPSGDDKFDLEVSPPFGAERITLFASTSPMGDVSVTSTGGVYAVKDKQDDLSTGTRGVKFTGKAGSKAAAEFVEASQEMTTAE